MVPCLIFIVTAMVMVVGMVTPSRGETRPAIDSVTIHSHTGVSLDFVYISPGEYKIGRDISRGELLLRALGQQGTRLDERPERRLKLKNGFYLCRHQVTASQFALFLNDVEQGIAERSIVLNHTSNLVKDTTGSYAARPGAARYPADAVTWDGAVEFTKWFTSKTGWSLRLPSEDEWEAAARTSEGFLVPTGGGDRRIDPKTGLVPGIRPGSASMEVDAFEENMTDTGLFHTLSYVGDWTSSAYRSDPADELPDFLFAEDDGGHVAKQCANYLTERNQGYKHSVFGLRVLLEATQSGSPLRKLRTHE